MCGRYALSFRVGRVRSRLADQRMPVAEAPDDDDDDVRTTYNFAPGYHGLIYRADTRDHYDDDQESHGHEGDNDLPEEDHMDDGPDEPEDRHPDNAVDEINETRDQSISPAKRTPTSTPNKKRKRDDGDDSPGKSTHSPTHSQDVIETDLDPKTRYKLQSAKWGLIPFWTKRPPDYGSQMRTINCRDDSLLENRGMWNVSKQRKRCIVICEGFYEWLKKNNGKERIPHYIKRKDGQLMTFAGLWDMVQYEGTTEKLYTYTIITTDSNKQLKFLHDRMPVILEPGSEDMKTWLDSNNIGWSKELQSMLKPFQGELEIYQVDKGVGKVGNNSSSFVIPIDSKENKSNIANFFGAQQAQAKQTKKKNTNDDRDTTVKVETSEDNAPLPKPADETNSQLSSEMRQETTESHANDTPDPKSVKRVKIEPTEKQSPTKATPHKPAKKSRSSTDNHTIAKTPVKEGNAKITSFFGK